MGVCLGCLLVEASACGWGCVYCSFTHGGQEIGAKVQLVQNVLHFPLTSSVLHPSPQVIVHSGCWGLVALGKEVSSLISNSPSHQQSPAC
jgi:hypothetical protein